MLRNLILAVGGSGTPSVLQSYGPSVVATAGLITALVAAFTRKDKKVESQSSTLDTRTNTALKGLEAYADRVEKERDGWQTRAETAEALNETLKDRVEDLERKLQVAETPVARAGRDPQHPSHPKPKGRPDA